MFATMIDSEGKIALPLEAQRAGFTPGSAILVYVSPTTGNVRIEPDDRPVLIEAKARALPRPTKPRLSIAGKVLE